MPIALIGPAFGGLLGGISPRLPFWIAAGLSLVNAIYGLFILPESLPREKRAPFQWKRANPVGSFFLLRKYPGVLAIASVAFLNFLSHEVLPSMWVLYSNYRYHWGTRTVGLTLAAVGVFSAAVQGGLIRPAVAKLGERRALLFGLGCGAIGFAAYGLAPTGLIFLVGIPFGALWGFSGPSVQALMTKLVDPSEQGRLQGALAGLRGISGMMGPGIFTGIFAFFIGAHAPRHLPGAPFLLAAALLFSAMLLANLVARQPD